MDSDNGNWCSLTEAAEELQITHRQLRDLINEGRVQGERDPNDGRGRWACVSVASILEYAAYRSEKFHVKPLGSCRRCGLLAKTNSGMCGLCHWELENGRYWSVSIDGLWGFEG